MKIFPKSKAGKITFGVLLLVLAAALLKFIFIPMYWYLSYRPQEGDIVFQSLVKTKLLPKTELVRMIEGITESCYSHCGVVVKRDDKWYVNEAIFDVHDTSLFTWIVRGRGAKFDVYRLKEEYREYIPEFIDALKEFQGRPYDYKYEMDDEYIYCSELVYKAFQRAANENLGQLVKLGDLNWKPYEKTIRKYEQGEPPLERAIITPVHLSRAPQLKKVFSNGI